MVDEGQQAIKKTAHVHTDVRRRIQATRFPEREPISDATQNVQRQSADSVVRTSESVAGL
jgi:hypothetical protein